MQLVRVAYYRVHECACTDMLNMYESVDVRSHERCWLLNIGCSVRVSEDLTLYIL